MRLAQTLILAATLLLPTALLGEVKMAGSTTTFLTVVKNAKDQVSKETGFAITATGSTTGKGFSALQAGQVDVALSADSLTSLIAAANAKGQALKAEDYEEIFLKNAHIVAIVHHDNPVPQLSEAQIVGILKGDIKTWKELGGKDAPILVFFEGESSANHNLIKSRLLKEATLAPKRLTVVDNVRLIASNVGETEPGFGFSPEMYLSGEVRVASDYKISQHLCFIIRKDASAEVRTVLAAFKAKL